MMTITFQCVQTFKTPCTWNGYLKGSRFIISLPPFVEILREVVSTEEDEEGGKSTKHQDVSCSQTFTMVYV